MPQHITPRKTSILAQFLFFFQGFIYRRLLPSIREKMIEDHGHYGKLNQQHYGFQP
jgi:hypothetical protein